ncbi:prenylated Rab acceptor [Lactococcus nasutitermitis]|uniref:Prenylated Rab acceptor n=1 Tax=Lactococcus nasutitermitis TaxID=1652957 RepID=A0ABV9JFA1_9LACT|nr:prenylated Rab acceptor [Lactococcus nasutitermitis]
MNVNQISQVIVTNLILIVVLTMITSVIWALIKYSIIDIVCEYDLEHPIITFFIIWFIPFGFWIEMFRNTWVDNTKRLVASNIYKGNEK